MHRLFAASRTLRAVEPVNTAALHAVRGTHLWSRTLGGMQTFYGRIEKARAW